MSYKDCWSGVFAIIEKFAEQEGIGNVSRGKVGYMPNESPFICAFASPLPIKFGEGAQAQRKSMEISIFIGRSSEDVADGLDEVMDIGDKMGDYLAARLHTLSSLSVEFDSIYGDNIVACVSITLYYR